MEIVSGGKTDEWSQFSRLSDDNNHDDHNHHVDDDDGDDNGDGNWDHALIDLIMMVLRIVVKTKVLDRTNWLD